MAGRPRLGWRPEQGGRATQMEHRGKEFEVRCRYCDVSHPIGTKRCIHCGNRIGGRASAPVTPAFGTPDDTVARPFTPIGEREPVDEEEMPTRSPLRIGMSVVWLVVLAIGMLSRMCTEGGG